MTAIDPDGPRPDGQRKTARNRRRGVLRLRTLLIWLAVVPTVAMGAQVSLTADRLLEQSANLREDVADGERIGAPLYGLMSALQAERSTTAARWAGAPVSHADLSARRAATDQAVAAFRRAADSADPEEGDRIDRHVRDAQKQLEQLGAYRERTDVRSGGADRTTAYYSGVIERLISIFGQFSDLDDAALSQQSRPVLALIEAKDLLAREDAVLASAGPSGKLSGAKFGELTNAVGAHRYLYDASIVPNLPENGQRSLARIESSDVWKTKVRIEDAALSDHQIVSGGVVLPQVVHGWPAMYEQLVPQLTAVSADQLRAVLASAEATADDLEMDLWWMVGGSAAALLLVVAVAVFTTRTVLRRLALLHERTVTVAEETLPEIVDRLQRGQGIDPDALPTESNEQDEVGRISDAFARSVAVSVDGHRQLADERRGFGMFAAGIASRTGNLVSRQLGLTEELQDTFGHDEALLAELMKSDQLTVGMRRQIENLLILADGEIPDPHVEPMRVADLLREAAAEVEEFRRIERIALDEVSVEPRVISAISHLLAELLDNATRFSPPASKVAIRAELVTDGLSVEIEDRGPRVAAERYEEMNGRLHAAPPYSVLAENAHRLGLFVVGHLADQLQARVTLRRSTFGGTSAIVIIPAEHLVRSEPASTPGAAAPRTPAPERRDARKPELTLHPRPSAPALAATVAGLPRRQPSQAPAAVGTPPADGAAPPPLPERRPQTHIAQQLRERRTSEPVSQDTATPEEVADAWADYEQGTETVEIELRRDKS
ncbi:sensor histidine kinase [Streptomyces sp. A1-5]|uniref:sensor histidine kinase n=1 Tax=Streptomyces sp. A1-5 TaxID=2738410 RepID=UPI001F27C443|nr:sensor histidine kinase [Streptomyces sp. A1-5]UJB44931.1 nitrate- and nitrite sensing domain-containing protein [Streptomyces sp. A1-5]